MLDRFRNRALGPIEKAVALVVGLAVLAAVAFVVVRLLPGKCGEGMEAVEGECVGVTAGVLDGDPQLDGLIRAVAAENADVEKDWKDPQNGRARIPYVRVALMMPFTSDASSAMSIAEITRALAGAFAAQLQANAAGSGPHYQLLLANDGKDLDHWQPVVDRLAAMTDDASPLVGVFGMPSSIPDTLDAAKVLSGSKVRIPVIGPVLTSTTMEAGYFFKTSPSNELFARALRAYLDDHPGSGTGFLVSDQREKDSYSVDLRNVFMKHYGKEYGLERRQASYLGVTGDDKGVPQRFTGPAQKICLSHADTVFFAGRDHDLPQLVSRLASEPSCDGRTKGMRILKVGIGMDPQTTTEDITAQLRRTGITLVSAASVDARSWKDGKGLPDGPRGFLHQFKKVRSKVHDEPAWGDKPLDDGYAVMYYDAFTVLAQATDQAYSENTDNGAKKETDGKNTGDERKKGSAGQLPTHDDVYNTLINMNILGTDAAATCVTCVRGASGTFGFDNSPDTRKWAVCKPVPVIVYPEPKTSGAGGDAGAGGGAGKKSTGTYRSFESIFGDCP